MRSISAICGGVVLWLGVVGCGSTQSSAGAQTPSASASETVATVDGVAITRGDLDDAIAPELAKLEEQAHQMRRSQLNELIATRLIESEARKRSLSREAYEKAEILDKAPAPGEAEIAAFIQANRARIPGDPTALLPQIRQYLTEQRVTARRDALVEELRAKSKVEVLLKAPVGFRATLDLAGTPARGPADAKVTVVEFSDFHCPFCKRVQPTLVELMAKYPKDVRLVYKHMPLDQLHPQARRAAEASWCAQQQGKFWEYHDALYKGVPDGTDQNLASVAGRVGLDAGQYQQCMSAGEAAKVVQAHVDEGARYGVSGTPGFFINGRFVNGAVPLETFVQLVEEELGR